MCSRFPALWHADCVSSWHADCLASWHADCISSKLLPPPPVTVSCFLMHSNAGVACLGGWEGHSHDLSSYFLQGGGCVLLLVFL